MYNKHYVLLDDDDVIIYGWSDAIYPERDANDAICINEHGSFQFRLIINGIETEENPPLRDSMFTPLYKWDGTSVLPRTEEEIEADRETARQAAEAAEQERIANATETVLLEMAADHEYRISLMELGIYE